eukprot:scaffold67016_cov63-Phaeocystis_antarctica.AAC.2
MGTLNTAPSRYRFVSPSVLWRPCDNVVRQAFTVDVFSLRSRVCSAKSTASYSLWDVSGFPVDRPSQPSRNLPACRLFRPIDA